MVMENYTKKKFYIIKDNFKITNLMDLEHFFMRMVISMKGNGKIT